MDFDEYNIVVSVIVLGYVVSYHRSARLLGLLDVKDTFFPSLRINVIVKITMLTDIYFLVDIEQIIFNSGVF